jgi:CBS domain-containing protein
MAASGNGRPHGWVPSGVVRHLMRSAFITVKPEDSLLDTQRIMRLARLRHLLVVSDGRLAGMISYRDLQERIVLYLESHEGADRDAPLNPGAAREAMAPLPAVVSPDTSVVDAALRLSRLRIGCLPVVEDGPEGEHVVGLVTESDLLRYAYEPLARRKP